MTGDLERDPKTNSEVVTVKIPRAHDIAIKLFGSLTGILIVAVFAQMIYFHGFKKGWEETGGFKEIVKQNESFRISTESELDVRRGEIDKNTAFRERGDRVTPKDLGAATDEMTARMEETTGLLETFIDSGTQTQIILMDIKQDLGEIKVELANVVKEQDRARDEIDRLRNTP